MPLAPDYPSVRLLEIMSSSEAHVIIVTRRPTFEDRLPADVKVLELPCASSSRPLAATANSSAGGMLLSSSGSTGKPKLILRTQRSFYHRLHWTWETLPFAGDEQCIQKVRGWRSNSGAEHVLRCAHNTGSSLRSSSRT